MRKTTSFTRATALHLTFIFTTNVLFANQVETSFWKERQKAAISNSQFSNSRHPGMSLAGIHNSNFTDWIPAFAGMTKHPTIIHIQDVHQNAEAQADISRIIKALIENKKIDAIALEGAFETIDLSRFQNYPRQNTIQKVANYLLKQKKISGAIHAVLTEKKPVLIFGVDDRTHYNANVQAYKDAAGLVEKNKGALAQKKREIASRKHTAFNPTLFVFDEKVEAYRDATVSMGPYVKLLAEHSNKIPSQAKIFLQAVDAEANLNIAQVEKERTQLLEQLVSSLKGQNREELVQTTIGYRMGKVSHSDFYAYITVLCDKNGVNLQRLPAMKAYLEYVLLADRINAAELFKDLRKMEESAYEALVQKPEERALVQESRHACLMGKLFDFALTKEEWKEYSSKETAPILLFPSPSGRGQGWGSPSFFTGKVGFKNTRSANSPGLPHPYPLPLRGGELKRAAESFERFYREADLRDHQMADNLLKAIERSEAKTVILVTGGYHAEGIDRCLSEKEIAIVPFVPKITKLDTANGTAYLSVFAQEKSPLEKLFDGEKLFLSPLQWTPPLAREAAIAGAAVEEAKNPHIDRPDAADQATYKELAGHAAGSLEVTAADVDGNRVTIHVQNPDTGQRLDEHYTVRGGAIGKGPSRGLRLELKKLTDDQFEHVKAAVSELEDKVKNVWKKLTTGQGGEQDQVSQVLTKLWAFLARGNTEDAAFGTFRAVVKSADDFLFAYATPATLGLFEDAFSERYLPHLAEILFHEGFSCVFGEPTYAAHRALVDGLQRKIFGEENHLRPVLRSFIQPNAEEKKLKNAIIAVNLMDAGVEIRPDKKVVHKNGIRKAISMVGMLAGMGVGTLYGYGGLFQMGEISPQLHQVEHAGQHFLHTSDKRVWVETYEYDTRKVERADGVVIRDGQGNSFAPTDMRELNRTLSEGDVSQDLDDLIATLHKENMEFIADFIPWRDPSAVNESNYKQFIHREVNPMYRDLWQNAQGNAEKEESCIKELLKENPYYAVVKITEQGQTRLVLIRHQSMSKPHKDQVVPNIFLREVRDYYLDSMKKLIDRGVDGIRIDLIHKLFKSEILELLWEVQPDLAKKYEDQEEPLRQILLEAKAYARVKGREFKIIGESYDGEREYLERDWDGLVDHIYYSNVFKDYQDQNIQGLHNSIDWALKKKGRLVVYPSNFDEESLANLGGPKYGFVAMLLLLAQGGVPLMMDLRELCDLHGHLIPIPGPAHPVSNDAELQKRMTHSLEALLHDSPMAHIAQQIPVLNKRVGVELLDSKENQRYVGLGVQTEGGDWAMSVTDFGRDRWGTEDSMWVSVPRGFLDLEELRDPTSQKDLERVNREYKLVHVITGKSFPVSIFADPADQMHPFRMNLPAMPADGINMFAIKRVFSAPEGLLDGAPVSMDVQGLDPFHPRTPVNENSQLLTPAEHQSGTSTTGVCDRKLREMRARLSAA